MRKATCAGYMKQVPDYVGICRHSYFFLERKDLLTTGIWHLKLDFKIGQFCTSVTISLNVSGTTQITRRYRIVLISFTLEHSILGKKIVYKNTIIILLRRQLLKADPGPAHRLIEFIGGGGVSVKFNCITCMYFNSIQLSKFTVSVLFSTLTTINLGYV